ncbi:MAG: ATP synthase F1 subunit epsilon [Lachnospiraceae bacterium]|nr:ATP synthase F1 subunit epsilon [Lachnospiraceae bacterium]
MNTFHLKIYESDSAFFEGEAEIAVIPVEDGEYGVMAGHENAVVAVMPGIMHYRPVGGEMQYASVGNGMLRVEKNDVLVLVETAERPEEINEARARAAEAEAREAMLQKKSYQEYRLAEIQLERELARLKLMDYRDGPGN